MHTGKESEGQLDLASVPIKRTLNSIVFPGRDGGAARTVRQIDGRSLYGIRSLSFTAERFQTLVEDCTKAEKSKDARDKFFLVAGGSFNDAEGPKILRSELPALTAAKASLATVVTSLSTVLPQLQFVINSQLRCVPRSR